MTSMLAALAALPVCLAGCQEAPGAAVIQIGPAAFELRTLDVGRGATLGAGDLDGDGHADIVASADREDEDSYLVVLRGDGTGDLVPATRFDAGPHPAEIVVADVDGDGHADVVAANHETRHLTLLTGDGTGGFSGRRTIDVDVEPHVHVPVARDLDGDGLVDLAVDHRDGEGVLFLRGEGGGGFAAGRLFDAGGDPYRGMATGELNGDGQLDFVTPNPREVGVLLSQGGASYELRRAAPVPAQSPFNVGLVDLDADGHLDLVVASGEGSDIVQVYRGNGAGGFEELDISPLVAMSGPKRVVTGDFDGNGVADAAVSGWGSGALLLLFGGAGGPRAGSAEVASSGNAWGLVAVDLNEDGRDDLAVADGDGPLLTILLSIDPDAGSGTEETP